MSRTSICAAAGCVNTTVTRTRRPALCHTCKLKAAKRRARARRQALKSDRKALADLKRTRLTRRVAAWQTKLKRATNGLKKAQRQLRAFEKRYTWNNFVGWDKRVPMPRLNAEQAHAASQSDESIDDSSNTIN